MINVTKYLVWKVINQNVKREFILKANEIATKMVCQGHKSMDIEETLGKLEYLKNPVVTWDVVTRHNFYDKTVEKKGFLKRIFGLR